MANGPLGACGCVRRIKRPDIPRERRAERSEGRCGLLAGVTGITHSGLGRSIALHSLGGFRVDEKASAPHFSHVHFRSVGFWPPS